MRFLFVAPRFHSNQFPIVKSLYKSGHKIEFFVQYIGKSEDHSIVNPYLMKKSLLSILFHKFIDYKYYGDSVDTIKMRLFIPSMSNLFKKIKNYRPDVVIVRDRNFSSMYVYFICSLLKIKCTILYNQSPLYTKIGCTSDSLVKRVIKEILYKYCFPKVRITPVCTSNISELRSDEENYSIKEHDYFVPFIAEVSDNVKGREYCQGGKINILDVGKYRNYKNHFLLVDAIALINDKNQLAHASP